MIRVAYFGRTIYSQLLHWPLKTKWMKSSYLSLDDDLCNSMIYCLIGSYISHNRIRTCPTWYMQQDPVGA